MNINLSTFDQLTGAEKRLAIEEGERKQPLEFASTAKNSLLKSIVKKTIQSENIIKTMNNPVDSLIFDTAIEIFSYLKSSDFIACNLVYKKWNEFIREDKENFLWNAIIKREFAFGKEKWEKYLGEVGEAPPLPNNIFEILKSPCQAFPGKSVAMTHVLTLIPQRVNEKPLTLRSIENLVKKPKQGNKTNFGFIWNRVKSQHGNKQVNESYWVLMTKDVLRDSRDNKYSQKGSIARSAMVDELSKKTDGKYQIPKLLEATVCIFTKYVENGTYLFNTNPRTYIYCKEKHAVFGRWNGGLHPLVIGDFDQKGLCISLSCSDIDWSYFGVAALRRF